VARIVEKHEFVEKRHLGLGGDCGPISLEVGRMLTLK
jgi:hypothetical protein